MEEEWVVQSKQHLFWFDELLRCKVWFSCWMGLVCTVVLVKAGEWHIIRESSNREKNVISHTEKQIFHRTPTNQLLLLHNHSSNFPPLHSISKPAQTCIRVLPILKCGAFYGPFHIVVTKPKCCRQQIQSPKKIKAS